jgi:CBS-domain-containing membrane protein
MTDTRTLFDRTAEDLMSRDVLFIPCRLSVRAAAHRLAQAGVSGAPVVDEEGRCLGVLTKTDLVRYLDQGPAPSPTSADLDVFADWQVMDLDALPADDVTRFMTTRVVTAAPSTLIGDLARLMCSSHIHRVLIVEGPGKVVGIVSSLDVLAALASVVIGDW